MAFSTTYNAALRAFERMELLLMATLIPVLGQVVAAMILLRQGAGLLGIAWAMIGSQVGAALLAGWLARRYLPGFRHHWTLSAHQYRQMLRAGGLLALLMAVAVIYQRIPILGLSLWATDEQTGWFAAAAKLVEAAKIVPYAYFGALFPVLVRRRLQPDGAGAPLHPAPAVGLSPEKDASSAGRPSSRPFTLLLLGALLLALAASAMAGPAVATVYGRGYEPAVPVLRILSWSLLPFLLTLKFSVELVSAGQEQRALLAVSLATLATALLMAGLRARSGLVGVAWAVVLGELFQAWLLLRLGRGVGPGA